MGSRASATRICSSHSARVGKRGGVVAAGHELVGTLDSIGEMRRRDIEFAHAGMQPLERVGVVGEVLSKLELELCDLLGRRGSPGQT